MKHCLRGILTSPETSRQDCSLAMAKRIGFAGVQISLGRIPVNGHLPTENRKTQLDYMSESQKLNFPITSTPRQSPRQHPQNDSSAAWPAPTIRWFHLSPGSCRVL